MQPLQVCTVSKRKLEDADENAQWGKAKPMQPMQLYVYSDPSTLIEDTFKNMSGEKSNKCSQCDFASSYASSLSIHLKMHSGEKSNKFNLCDYASSWAGDLKKHMKMHSGEKTNKCNQCDYASSWAGEETFENARWRKAKQM